MYLEEAQQGTTRLSLVGAHVVAAWLDYADTYGNFDIDLICREGSSAEQCAEIWRLVNYLNEQRQLDVAHLRDWDVDERETLAAMMLTIGGDALRRGSELYGVDPTAFLRMGA